MPEILLPPQPLTDGVVLLRAPREDDVAALTAACQDPEISRWTRIPSPYTEENARQWLARQPGERTRGESVSFAVTDAVEGTLLGVMGLIHISWEDTRAELGAWMSAQARGRGTSQRALRLLVGWAMHTLGFQRLEALIHPLNTASRRLVERLDFTQEGLLRSYSVMKGERVDLLLFSMLPGDSGAPPAPAPRGGPGAKTP
jgi:RimJ/RimL family protein N-acetyltransferase